MVIPAPPAAARSASEPLIRLEDLFDTVETIILALDSAGVITRINHYGAKLLGLPAAEIVGRSWFADFLPQPEGRDQVQVVFQKILAGELEGAEYFENDILVADGSRRTIAWHSAWLKDATGNITGALSAGNDITSYKRMEATLRHSLEDLQRAQAIGRIGSWRLDVLGNQLTWSPETYRLFDIEPERPMNYEAFLDRVHPDDRDYVARQWQAALAGEKYDIEHRIVVGTRVRWIRERAELEFDADGRLLSGYGTAQDVTELKLATQTLLATERWLLQAQEVARIGFFNYDIGADSWHGSAVLDEIFGIVPGYPKTGAGWLALTHPDDRTAMTAHFEGAIAGKLQRCDKVYRIRRHDDGTESWLHGYGSIEHDADGKPVRMIGVVLDITKQKRAEIARDQANRQRLELAARLEGVREEERTRIARELHDELGQTLTAVKMHLRRFISKLQYFDRSIALEMMDVVRMVDDTAGVVRRIAQELRPHVLDTLDLAGAIEWEVAAFRKRMGIRCEYIGPTTEPVVPDMTRVHIYRLFQEALTNIARHARATRVTVTLRHIGEELLLVVEDNGRGFGREALVGGTLGFAGMQERATLVEGTLTIDTRPDFDGTRITLRVPMHAVEGSART